MLDYILLGVILGAVLANFLHFIFNTFKGMGDTVRGLGLRCKRWLREILVVQVVAIKPVVRHAEAWEKAGEMQEERKEKGEVETPRSVAGNRSEKHDRTVSSLIQYDPSKFKLVPISSQSPYNNADLK
jgi:hypothetical protein